MQVGNCFLATSNPSEAADWYRRVLALDAKHPYAHHNLAVCFFQSDDYEAGVEHCLEALKCKPDYVMAMHNAAIAYVQLARWKEAREMLKKALRHDPSSQTLEQLVKRLWRLRIRATLDKLWGGIRRVLQCPLT